MTRGRTMGLTLVDARITNAVRCVPPENKPTPAEIKTCRTFLEATIAEMRNLRAIVTLGRIAHESTVAALNHRRAAAPFGHGASHEIGKLRALRQLSLLALQHQHRRADAEDVPRCIRGGARFPGR